MNNTTVLFSPIGGTDPISETNFYDGAMLHIARHYHPDRIYMYMSKEVIEKQNRDERYTYCLDKLYESMGLQCEYKLIEREDLTEVHKFDYFYEEFEQILKEIRQEIGEEGNLILNISSGTPAMKSALMVLATLGKLNCKTIQVATPERKMNEHQHDKEDIRELWEINPDNDLNSQNRCEEVNCPALDIIQQKNHIKKLLSGYDYAAAYEIALDLPKRHNESYIELLKMADRRILLDFREVDKILNVNKSYELPVKASNNRLLFEYALMLDIKLKRHEYADFIRAVSPIIVELFFRIIKNQLNIDVEKYCKDRKWNSQKLQSDAQGRELIGILNKAYESQGGFKGSGPVYAVHLKEIAIMKQITPNILSLIEDLRSVEEKLRNPAAHTMISITEKTVAEVSGFSAEQIMKKIKDCFVYAGINIKTGQWHDYDRMNSIILRCMDQMGSQN